MAEGRRGLGRGLSALLGESEAELASAEARDADRAVASAAARETPDAFWLEQAQRLDWAAAPPSSGR